MISISRQEMLYFTKEKHVPFGEGGISRTHSHHKSYYLCQARNNMKWLNEYRRNRIVKE